MRSFSQVQKPAFRKAPLDPDDFEKLILQRPDPKRLQESLFKLTRYPHTFGVANVSHILLEEMIDGLRHIENATVELQPFSALSSIPIDRHVWLKSSPTSSPVELVLDEAVVPQDPTSGDPRIIPLWAGYGPSTPNAAPTPAAPVVYANYCRDEDYDYLDARGVSVSGCVVLCRYGKIFRAQKAQFAEARGAVGVLVYSDPADDGFKQDDEYPAGVGRPPSGGQRGTYLYGQYCSGDPDPERVARLCGNVTLMPSIPIQPLGWASALPILQALQGLPVVTDDGWQGGLPLHYHVGPGPAQVMMQFNMSFARRKGYNVLSRIPGSHPDNQAVMVGCHHDAWVFGASDPLSGQAVLIELAHVLGHLWKVGWRPKRSIIIAAWDGEEYNLLGSTHFVDTYAKEKMEKIVAYVNIDGIVGNWFPNNLVLSAAISPVLANVLQDAAMKTPSPVAGSNATMWSLVQSLDVLGDGSDYCAFINHVGVSSIDLQIDSPNLPEPQYHSRYDSFYLMNTTVDPAWQVHKAGTQLVGLIMYALSTQDNIDFSPAFAASQYASYKTSLITQFPILSQADWSDFDIAMADFTEIATNAEDQVSGDHTIANLLANLDRTFLIEEGLPGRRYFRHVMQAPDLHNDYNSQVFPGVAFYAASGDITNANVQIQILTQRITAATQSLRSAVAVVQDAVRISVIVVSVVLVGAILIITIGYIVRKRRKTQYVELPTSG